MRLAPKLDLSVLNWGPAGIDEAPPPVAPDVTCPQQQVMEQVGARLNEVLENISRFDAVEEVIHEEHDRRGKAQARTRKKFAYIANIAQPRPDLLTLEEYRQGLAGAAGADFPGGIATLGFPVLAFTFHPIMRDNFVLFCEGLGQWQGQPTWLLHFRQREDKLAYLLAYRISGEQHPVPLKGRAWVAAGNFHVVHMETELVRPMKEIQLLKHHQIVDYGMVTFNKGSAELWLPRKAELYFHFRGHRYYRQHLFDSFRLFAVVVSHKDKVPPAETPP